MWMVAAASKYKRALLPRAGEGSKAKTQSRDGRTREHVAIAAADGSHLACKKVYNYRIAAMVRGTLLR